MIIRDIISTASEKFTDWGKWPNTCNRVATKKAKRKNLLKRWFHLKTQRVVRNSLKYWYTKWKVSGLTAWIWRKLLVFRMVREKKKNLKLASKLNNLNSRQRTPMQTGMLQDLKFMLERDFKEFMWLVSSCSRCQRSALICSLSTKWEHT